MSRTDRVRETWAKSIIHRDAFATRFYVLLFQKAPETKPLFKTDMESQGIKLVDTLNFIVDHLDDPDQLFPAARELAIRHVSYGVEPGHYDVVGLCLIEALRSILGPDFDTDAEDAWIETYQQLVGHMLAKTSLA